MHADFTGLEIDRLAVAEDRASFQVHNTVGAEGGDHRAGLRVQRDQAIAGRDVEDPFVAAAVGPVRHAASRQLARRGRRALSFTVTVRPDQLAGLAVEGDHRTARAAGRIKDAVHGERCSFELVFRARAEHVGFEVPRQLELGEVGGVDLVERRVSGAGEIGGVVRPVALRRRRGAGGAGAVLTDAGGDPTDDREQAQKR
jgi:hypothetical protein